MRAEVKRREVERQIAGLLRVDVEEVAPAVIRVLAIFNAPALASDPTPGRWRRKTAHEHVFASLSHIAQHLRGRREEDHLAHAAARLLLAMASD